MSFVQNLDLEGKVSVSSKDFTALLREFHAELQLTPMDLREITKVSPAISTSRILFPIEGALSVDVDSLRLDEAGLPTLFAKAARLALAARD